MKLISFLLTTLLLAPLNFGYSAETKAGMQRMYSENFIGSGWHPYVGLNYNLMNTSMQRNYSQSEYSRSRFIVGESYEYVSTKTANGISAVIGIGKLYYNNKLYFGLEAEGYMMEKSNFDAKGDMGNGGKFNIRPTFDIGIRLGIPLSSIFMPYVKLGLSYYKMYNSPWERQLNSPINDNRKRAQDLKAEYSHGSVYIGTGFEYKIAERINVRAEYKYNKFSENDNRSYSPDANFNGYISFNPNKTSYTVQTLKLGVIYTF